MKDLFLFLCTLNIVTIGCNYIPCSASSDLSNVKTIQDAASISGVYKPDRFTRQDFKEYSNADSTMLLLSADGTITLKNFPKQTFDSWHKLKTDVVNASGTWTSTYKSGTVTINTNITFDQARIIAPEPFRLFKKNDKYYILIDFGDPDACESVRLEQQ